MDEAGRIIAALGLAPHPEGGHFRETFRDARTENGRACGTAIYYLLRETETSRWHRIDAAEIWHWYGGAPLELRIAHLSGEAERVVLGGRIPAGERPQAVVPAGAWQSARPLGPYALLGCTVAPGFEFAGFEIAPDGFAPPGFAR